MPTSLRNFRASLGPLLQEPHPAAARQPDQGQRRRHKRCARRIASCPPKHALHRSRGTCHNRFVPLEPMKIFREGRGARVTPLWVFLEALQANGLRVARHRGVQP